MYITYAYEAELSSSSSSIILTNKNKRIKNIKTERQQKTMNEKRKTENNILYNTLSGFFSVLYY